MRGRARFGLIRRMSVPALAAVLGLALAGGAEAAPGAPGGATAVARAAAVSTPIVAVAGDRGESREGTRDGRRTRTRVVYRPYYGSFGWYGGWGSYWPYYSPYAFGPYGLYGWGPGAVGYAAPNAGALDINTKPKKASVYLDGELIGRVDSFDGFPRYLWLREGSYRLAIFMEGHETLEREVRVRPGVVIKIDEDLVPGTAVRPLPPAPEPAGAGGGGRTDRGPWGSPGGSRTAASRSGRTRGASPRVYRSRWSPPMPSCTSTGGCWEAARNLRISIRH